MTIGINGNEANVEHLVGVNQYARELLCALARLIVQRSPFTVCVYLSRPPIAGMPKETGNWRYRVFGPRRLWTLTGLQAKLVQEKLQGTAPDVFFTPTHYAPLFMAGIPSVVSIMDMSFERFPQFFKKSDLYQLRYWTRISAIRAKKILTISQFSKEEICRIYGLPSDKVVVTYPGYDRSRFSEKVKSQKSKVKSTKGKYKIYNDYILYIGTLQPRKNLVRLVQAFSTFNASRYTLVVAGMSSEGRGGWMYQEIFEEIKKLKIKDRVVFTGYVPDEDVPYLLAGAEAYVLPSLYEGFGIPAIEAMATGVPVVVSRVSSLPEICGEAAIYIDDPYDIGSIQRALKGVVFGKASERAKLVELGLKWVKRYNWEETARKTLEALQQVISD